jgi:hypothetical protein
LIGTIIPTTIICHNRTTKQILRSSPFNTSSNNKRYNAINSNAEKRGYDYMNRSNNLEIELEMERKKRLKTKVDRGSICSCQKDVMRL